METINIDIKKARKVYSSLSAEERAAVEKVLPRSILASADIRDRVQTFQDACEVIGLGHEFVRAYAATRFAIRDLTDKCDVLSYLRLRIIVCALNEGWDSRQYMCKNGYGPHYILIDNEEYKALSHFDKEMCVEIWQDVDGVPLHAKVGVCRLCPGNALAIRTPELARYAALQFAREYISLLFRYHKE